MFDNATQRRIAAYDARPLTPGVLQQVTDKTTPCVRCGSYCGEGALCAMCAEDLKER